MGFVLLEGGDPAERGQVVNDDLVMSAADHANGPGSLPVGALAQQRSPGGKIGQVAHKDRLGDQRRAQDQVQVVNGPVRPGQGISGGNG